MTTDISVDEFSSIVGDLSEGVLACSYNDSDIFRMLISTPGMLNMEAHCSSSCLIDKSTDYEKVLLTAIKQHGGWPVNCDEITPLGDLSEDYIDPYGLSIGPRLGMEGVQYLGYIYLEQKFVPTGDENEDLKQKLCSQKIRIPLVVYDLPHWDATGEPRFLINTYGDFSVIVNSFTRDLLTMDRKFFDGLLMHIAGMILMAGTSGVPQTTDGQFVNEHFRMLCAWDRYIVLFSDQETLFHYLERMLSIVEQFGGAKGVPDCLARIEWHKRHISDPDYLPTDASGVFGDRINATDLEFVLHLK